MIPNATAWFGTLSPLPRRSRSVSPKTWTCVGLLAIPLWATWPALSLQTRALPPLECMTVAFSVAFIALSSLKPSVAATDSESCSPWIPALAFAGGVSGSAILFLLATHYIPAAEANLILYLWPVMVVGLGAAFRVFRLRLRHGVGIGLGFTAAAILMGGGRLSLSYTGIGLALLGGLSWALYCIFRLKWRGPTGPVLTRGFAISAALCAVLHLLSEPFVIPNMGSAAAAGVIGIVPAAFANLVWDWGFRRGDSQLLAVMAYATPFCSMLLLAALGLQSLNGELLLAGLLIVFAGLLSRTES